MVGGEQRSRRSYDLGKHVGGELDIHFYVDGEEVNARGVLGVMQNAKGVQNPGFYAVIGREKVHLPLKHSKYVREERAVRVNVQKGSSLENQLKKAGVLE
jgi:hypothetical protein